MRVLYCLRDCMNQLCRLHATKVPDERRIGRHNFKACGEHIPRPRPRRRPKGEITKHKAAKVLFES